MITRTIPMALAILSLLGGATPALATVITVDGGGGGDHLTITDGLGAAASGDTVLVAPGTYAETVTLGKAVVLRSSGGSLVTTVSGPLTNQDVLTVTADGAAVEGFTLTAGRQGLVVAGAVSSLGVADLVLSETGTHQALLPPHLVAPLVPQLTLVGHASGKYDAVRIETGTLTASTTWPVLPPGFVYLLQSDNVTVAGPSGPVLTIPAGTIVKFYFSRFEIGTNSDPGGLVADGVIFTSRFDDVGGDTNGTGTAPSANNWQRLDFTANARADSSLITNCEIKYGGSGTGAVQVDGSDPLILGNTFTGNSTDLYVEDSPSLGALQTGNTINQGAGLPIATTLDHVQNLVFGNTIVPRGDNRWNGINIFSSAVDASWTLPVLPHGFVYYLSSAVITVAGPSGPVLTIPTGTIIKNYFSRFEIGTNSDPGGLVADGVIFTSRFDDVGGDTNGTGTAPSANNWQRLDFTANARADSSLITNCEIKYGGSGTGAVQVDGSDPLILGNTFTGNSTDLYVEDSPSLGALQTGNTINQGAGLPIATTLDHVQNLVFGNTIVPRGDNRWNGINIFSSTVDASWTLPVLPHGFVYYLSSAVITVAGPSGPVLTIPTGTIIKNYFSRFEIGTNSDPGGLVADGVIFTSRFDDVGGDTNGTGTAPSANNWQRLDFTANARADSSLITNCEIKYGGSGTGAVQVDGSDPLILGNTFTGNSTDLYVEDSPSLGALQTGNTINQGAGLPIATTLDHVQNLVFGNTIVPRGDNRWNGINIFSSAVDASWTLPVLPHGFVYYLSSAVITVAGPSAPVLTIPTGTIIKNYFSRFEIGTNSDPGGLVADGVIFTSRFDDVGGDTNGTGTAPSANNWQRLDFGAMALESSSLTGCEIRYGGNPMVEVNSSRPSFSECEIRDSSGVGFLTQGEGALPTLRFCTLSDNDIGLKAQNDGYANLVRCCFTDNATYGIEALAPTGERGTFLATNCWWGAADGPSGEGPGSGDAVSTLVLFDPWYATEACTDFPSDVPDGNELPAHFQVRAAYPNPFNPSTTIAFALPEEAAVSVEIFTLAGRRLATLLEDVLGPGAHEVVWRGRDRRGGTVAAGLYFYRVTADRESRTGKLMLVK